MLRCYTFEDLSLDSNGAKAFPDILVIRRGSFFVIEMGPDNAYALAVRHLGRDDFLVHEESNHYRIKEASIIGTSCNFALIPPTVIDTRSRALVKILLRSGKGGKVSPLVWMTEYGIVVSSVTYPVAEAGEVGEYLLVIPDRNYASVDVTDQDETQWRYVFAFKEEEGVSVAVNCNVPRVGIPTQ